MAHKITYYKPKHLSQPEPYKPTLWDKTPEPIRILVVMIPVMLSYATVTGVVLYLLLIIGYCLGVH